MMMMMMMKILWLYIHVNLWAYVIVCFSIENVSFCFCLVLFCSLGVFIFSGTYRHCLRNLKRRNAAQRVNSSHMTLLLEKLTIMVSKKCYNSKATRRWEKPFPFTCGMQQAPESHISSCHHQRSQNLSNRSRRELLEWMNLWTIISWWSEKLEDR